MITADTDKADKVPIRPIIGLTDNRSTTSRFKHEFQVEKRNIYPQKGRSAVCLLEGFNVGLEHPADDQNWDIRIYLIRLPPHSNVECIRPRIRPRQP